MLKAGLSIAKVSVTRSLHLDLDLDLSILGNVLTECSERRNDLNLWKHETEEIKQRGVIAEMGKW
jgi:hypothetical protein